MLLRMVAADPVFISFLEEQRARQSPLRSDSHAEVEWITLRHRGRWSLSMYLPRRMRENDLKYLEHTGSSPPVDRLSLYFMIFDIRG